MIKPNETARCAVELEPKHKQFRMIAARAEDQNC